MLKIIKVSVDLLLSLIDDILDNAKICKNAFVLNYSEFKLSEFMDEVKSLFELQAEGKELYLKSFIKNGRDLFIDATIVSD